jgi:hypothetical protein
MHFFCARVKGQWKIGSRGAAGHAKIARPAIRATGAPRNPNESGREWRELATAKRAENARRPRPLPLAGAAFAATLASGRVRAPVEYGIVYRVEFESDCACSALHYSLEKLEKAS